MEIKREYPLEAIINGSQEIFHPKHLTMRKNVEKFSLPEHLHGKTQWLMKIIKNFDVEKIRLLMERKIEKGV